MPRTTSQHSRQRSLSRNIPQGSWSSLLLIGSLCSSILLPCAHAQSWPHNLPKHQKYYPEHEGSLSSWSNHGDLVRKKLEVEQRLLTEAPVATRGVHRAAEEMFLPGDWVFADELSLGATDVQMLGPHSSNQGTGLRSGRPQELADNGTLTYRPLPPFLSHWTGISNAQGVLSKRDFTCPTGTHSCTGISRPDSCCPTDEVCMLVQDTGLGDVGCCANGQSCAGSVAQCDTANGYHSCPGSDNGGCCIPGYVCQGIGCIQNTTTTTQVFVTVTVTPTPVAGTSTSLSVIVLTPSTTTITVTGSSDAQVTATPVPTNIVSATDGSCVSGFNSCASSLGGGCCPTDRACGSGGLCPPLVTVTVYAPTSGSTILDPAVRPTDSGSQSLVTITSANICPASYYQCSAYYVGGCCQIGRDCSSTNCPSRSTETLESGSVVVVVPTVVESSVPLTTSFVTGTISSDGADGATGEGIPAATLLPTDGSCQNGWFICGGGSQGGGCCPSGYVCGASCTATAGPGPSKVAKADVLGAASGLRVPALLVVAVVAFNALLQDTI